MQCVCICINSLLVLFKGVQGLVEKMSFQKTFKDSNGLSILNVCRQVIPFKRSSKRKSDYQEFLKI